MTQHVEPEEVACLSVARGIAGDRPEMSLEVLGSGRDRSDKGRVTRSRASPPLRLRRRPERPGQRSEGQRPSNGSYTDDQV